MLQIRYLTVIALLLAATFFVAGESQAQRGPGMRCLDRFASMDTNKDGQVDRAEFESAPHPGCRAAEMFDARDTNHDGLLTKEEFCAGKGMGRGRQ